MENMLFGGRKKARKIGGSIAISIPMTYLKTKGIKKNDMVELWFDAEKIIIIPYTGEETKLKRAE